MGGAGPPVGSITTARHDTGATAAAAARQGLGRRASSASTFVRWPAHQPCFCLRFSLPLPSSAAITAGRRRAAEEPAVPVPASQKAAGAAAVEAAEGERKKRKRKRQPRYPKG